MFEIHQGSTFMINETHKLSARLKSLASQKITVLLSQNISHRTTNPAVILCPVLVKDFPLFCWIVGHVLLGMCHGYAVPFHDNVSWVSFMTSPCQTTMNYVFRSVCLGRIVLNTFFYKKRKRYDFLFVFEILKIFCIMMYRNHLPKLLHYDSSIY